ncbi:hypothetical protein AB0L06_42375 [Spirillospora sp. NPDC052269]
MAATVTFGAAAAAHAADGVLIIDGSAHRNPHGCFPLGDYVASTVVNKTDTDVKVWSDYGCKGRAAGLIRPGETTHPRGRSISID